VLLAVGSGGQDDVRRMGALVAMMADVDLQTVLERTEIDLVRAESQQHLRLLGHDIRDAALLREAEHQRAHASSREVKNVEPVPAIADEVELLRQRQRRIKRTCDKRAAA